MSVKYHNFGGVIGWNLQKYFPNLSSDSYLKLQRSTRNKLQQEYIDYFLSTDEPPMPLVVNLETINRCNSTCSFCTANKNAENQSPCVIPQATKTTGIKIVINRMSTHAMEPAP